MDPGTTETFSSDLAGRWVLASRQEKPTPNHPIHTGSVMASGGSVPENLSGLSNLSATTQTSAFVCASTNLPFFEDLSKVSRIETPTRNPRKHSYIVSSSQVGRKETGRNLFRGQSASRYDKTPRVQFQVPVVPWKKNKLLGFQAPALQES